jgi:hypothetical protein
VRSRDGRAADARDGDHVDLIQERLPAGQERLRDTRAYGSCHPLSQVSVAVRQAESDPEVSAVEGWAVASDLSGLRSTVSAVSNSEGEGLRPIRSHLGKRVWSVGDRSSDKGHRARVEQASRHEADDARLSTYSSQRRARESGRAFFARIRRGDDRGRGAVGRRGLRTRGLGRQRWRDRS